MAIKDVFNNSNDNYLKTGLSPCTGSDTNIFQFFAKKEVGVSNGSQILQVMNLGDIQVEVGAWDQNRKTLGPGEVTYISGLTKELDNRAQTFNSPVSISDASLDYIEVKFDVNYNLNFKNTLKTIDVSSNPITGVTIENAIDLALSSFNIGINSSVDTSTLTLTGINAGYNFSISNATLTQWADWVNIDGYLVRALTEDITKDIQYAKYINGAMLGIVLKASYPTEESTYDKWLNISHVNNTFSFYEDPSYYTKIVDTGSSTTSTSTTICAGDYLNYITINNEWDKIGYLYIKVNTFDQDNTTQKNLVPGFYIFNPHTFSVDIDYMMIN